MRAPEVRRQLAQRKKWKKALDEPSTQNRTQRPSVVDAHGALGSAQPRRNSERGATDSGNPSRATRRTAHVSKNEGRGARSRTLPHLAAQLRTPLA